MVVYCGGTRKNLEMVQSRNLSSLSTSTLEISKAQKFLEVLLLSIIRTQVLLSIWLVLNKDISYKLTRENKLKSHRDSDWTQENITDQSILSRETQVTQSTSCLLEIGQLKYGLKISKLQLCRQDIIVLTWQQDAGHLVDVVFSSWQEWTVSLMCGTSSIDKMR